MPKTDKLVIFGNPPYQREKGRGAMLPIYHKFIDACIALSPRYLSMIVPSRWIQRGLGLKDFRDKIKKDKRMKLIKLFDGPKSVFADVAISGGVLYFLWDKNHNGFCELNGHKQDLDKYDIIITDNNAFPIIEKMTGKNLNEVVFSVDCFKIITSFDNWQKDGIKCYGSYGKINNISLSDFTDKNNILKKYKVCVCKASSAHHVIDKKGTLWGITKKECFIVESGAVCTRSYLVIGVFDTKQEAENFISYVSTKCFRFLFTLTCASYNITKTSFSFVPDLQDYTHPWDDKQVCEKIGITDEEFKYIDSKIRDWKETK